jgi:sialic acid synthase SpsE
MPMLREIGGRSIGSEHPVFVIAEVGLNHSGSLERALAMVDAAAWAGASAVKLQTLEAASLVSVACPAPAHVRASSLRDFFSAFELNREAHRAIVKRARDRNLAVMSTPFSIELVGMLHDLGIDAFKIASGDVTFDGLIAAVADTSRPLVMSTGMSSLLEVGRAIDIARTHGATDLAALHCVSAYPTPAASQNLRAITTLDRYLRIPVGLSDHSAAAQAAIPAVALGACIYERHLVLEDDLDAIDRPVSSTPSEFKQLIAMLELTRRALGDGRKVCQAAEKPNQMASRRGLYATRALKAGTRLSEDDIVALRPATSLTPAACHTLIGSVLSRNVAAGAPFAATDIALERAS